MWFDGGEAFGEQVEVRASRESASKTRFREIKVVMEQDKSPHQASVQESTFSLRE